MFFQHQKLHNCNQSSLVFDESYSDSRSRWTGGREMEDVKIGEPKEGEEVKVKNKAIGINFIDIYFRRGVYKAATNPFIPGMEAVGEVIAIGQGLTGGNIGDIVAYAGNPKGAFTEEQIFPVEKHVPVPTSIDPATTASIVYKWIDLPIITPSML